MSIDSLRASLADRYTIEWELGAGGMATVYLAHDIKHDRDVAIKVMREELASSIGADRFLREIAVIAKLQHPNILPLFDSGVVGSRRSEVGSQKSVLRPRPELSQEAGNEGGDRDLESEAPKPDDEPGPSDFRLPTSNLYYVTPYIRGETLRELLDRNGRLTVDQATSLATEVADALAYSHREGVVHRDIKPDNILLQEGHAVVADFGVARALAAAGGSTMTQAGFAIGTPAYMSPEQATGASDIDGKSDVYATGCLLFEMLTGKPPFTGANLQQVAAAHVTTPAPPIASIRSDIPRPLTDLVAECLGKDPGQRPDAAALASRLKNAASAASVSGSYSRTIAIAAGVVLLVAAGIWWAIGRGGSSSPAVAEGAERIAVMPLSAVSDTSLSRLGQDLVVTLSTTLDGVGELSTVDASTLLLNTRDAPSPLPLAQAREIASRLGAGSVLTGTLIGESGQVRASVALYPVGSDTAIAKASALAPLGDIAALTDSLTWQMLRQVWRRGEAPSPVLTGLTTKSFEALRTFLDGERLFYKLDVQDAIQKYQRAFELDSNFVQAYLRYDYARTWNLQGVDESAHERLLLLAHKLPERERLWLQATGMTTPLPEQTATWRKLIQRYPDYPPILMSGIDDIIHSGPVYGIGLEETVPILDRLAKLTPDNSDVWFHKGIVEEALGARREAVTSFRSGAALAGGVYGRTMAWQADLNESLINPDSTPSPEDGMALARRFGALPLGAPTLAWSGMMGFSMIRLPERLALVERARREGVYTGEVLSESYLGEGLLRIARGDWAGGLQALERNESSNVPIENRFSTARIATIGAWLGTVDPAVAVDAVKRAQAMPGAEELPRNLIELRWFDGLMAIVTGDEPRLRQTVAALRQDSSPRALHVAKSLNALWLVKQGVPGAADSVRAISDAAMRDGNFGFAAEMVNRLVIARALRARGKPADVERYLMWVDAGLNAPRAFGPEFALGPTVRFERGMALEEAGDHAAAVKQLNLFVATLDQPPASQREMVAEARRVVAGKGEGDVPAQPGLARPGGKQ